MTISIEITNKMIKNFDHEFLLDIKSKYIEAINIKLILEKSYKEQEHGLIILYTLCVQHMDSNHFVP